mgnify:CR=1 FL=1|tara:strand:- start:949 stop:1146 length:198 start_codon:yes stop_codon:yes gene_type:complete
MAKRGKNEGSEFNSKDEKKRIEQISNRGKGPYKEPATQKQAIKTYKLDYDVWTGDPVEIHIAKRN